MELWNGTDAVKRKIIIENPNARVLFHYNPKLCLSKIWEFVHQAEINPPAPNDNIDIGITNGDKAPCKQLFLHNFITTIPDLKSIIMHL